MEVLPLPGTLVYAPAKINLFLSVTGKRPDGYHELDTVMQSVTLCDTVTISRCDHLRVVCSDPALSGRDNLAYRAAEAFCQAAGMDAAASIRIEKAIPVAAGLAGGSSDAAAVLYALQKMRGRPLPEEQFFALAASIGADVPFCILGGLMRCRGIGEAMTPCGELPPCAVLLAFPEERVSAADAYRRLDEAGWEPVENRLLPALESGDLGMIGGALYNVFQPLNPTSDAVAAEMKRLGAAGAVMSGSGPSVFGLFDTENAAEAAGQKLAANGIRTAVALPRPMRRL